MISRLTTSAAWKRIRWWSGIAIAATAATGIGLLLARPIFPANWSEGVVIAGATLFVAAPWPPIIVFIVADITAGILGHRELMRRIEQEAIDAACEECGQQP